jgi:leucyl/phenylalanyl-tRNA--protein transferase
MFSPPKYFPPPESADEQGCLGVGGELSPAWLLDAYRHGIFPWPVGEMELAWWSPDPRAIFELDGLHISRRLARTCASGRFEVTCDRDFAGVMHGCATAQSRRYATWITQGIRRAYIELHQLGFAHSIEVWHEGQLAGGTYGVALGGLFAAESMFYRVRDASKVALVYLAAHLRARGYELWDIQQLTAHTQRLGAIEIPRHLFLSRLTAAVEKDITFGPALCGEMPQ